MSIVNDNIMGSGGPQDLSPVSPLPVDEMTLHRYLDGRLNARERQAVEAALKTQSAARRTLDALREEDKLLREALETRTEPTRRIGDKVLVTLHNEERVRLHGVRTRRLRRQVFSVMSAAACLLICVWLVKPRDAAGQAVSGTPATVVKPTGEKSVLTRETAVYHGDTVLTIQGQFVRLRMAGDALLDIDEHSRIGIEKGEVPTLRMEAGRAGASLAESRQDLIVLLPQGRLQLCAGALVDVWLPSPSCAQWPQVLESGTLAKAVDAAGRAKKPENGPAVVTVLQGSAYATPAAGTEAIALAAGQRLLLEPHKHALRNLDMAASHVLDMRSEPSWHAMKDGGSPRDRRTLGVLESPDFNDLGRRLNLAQKPIPAIAEALKHLQDAGQAPSLELRAQRLQIGQQKLRDACQLLDREDECRRFGRMLEGLAHMQRGWALAPAAAAAADEMISASEAFTAAYVAFDEALQPGFTSSGRTPVPEMKPAWPRRLAGSTLTLADLTPADQSALLSAYYRALSGYWLARTQPAAPGASAASDAGDKAARALAAAAQFEALESELDRSIEGLSARLAEGLAYNLAGKSDKSAQVLQEVAATRLHGCADDSRRRADGIKQAALLALVRLHAGRNDLKKARAAAEDFWLLYPLDAASPAAEEIERTLNAPALQEAERALNARDYTAAVERFDELLAGPGPIG